LSAPPTALLRRPFPDRNVLCIYQSSQVGNTSLRIRQPDPKAQNRTPPHTGLHAAASQAAWAWHSLPLQTVLTASHYQACGLQILVLPLMLSPMLPSTAFFPGCSFRRLRVHILRVPNLFRMSGSAVLCDSSSAVLCDSSSAELCDRAAQSALCTDPTDPTATHADSSAVAHGASAIIADSRFFIAALSCPAEHRACLGRSI